MVMGKQTLLGPGTAAESPAAISYLPEEISSWRLSPRHGVLQSELLYLGWNSSTHRIVKSQCGEGRPFLPLCLFPPASLNFMSFKPTML